MNLVFVIKALAAGPGGGAERVLATLSAALAERGHKVTILTFDRPGSADFYEVPDSVERVRLGIGDTTARSGLSVTVARLRQVRGSIKELSPDVAIGFMHSAFIPLALALINSGIPIVASERTSFSHYLRHPISRLLLWTSLPFVTAFTANNFGVRRGFPQAIARRMRVIQNPVMPASGSADPIGGAAKRLLSVGGLRSEKDHATLVAAFARVTTQFADWQLRIVGDGPLLSALQSQVQALGVADRVVFAGASNRVEDEYRRAQLFVLPSAYEAFPNCIAEALAHGLPAIGFADCPGTNELILPGVNGLLASGPDRVDALASALGAMMGSPEQRLNLGKAAPATVADYLLDRVAADWEDLFRSVSRGPQT